MADQPGKLSDEWWVLSLRALPPQYRAGGNSHPPGSRAWSQPGGTAVFVQVEQQVGCTLCTVMSIQCTLYILGTVHQNQFLLLYVSANSPSNISRTPQSRSVWVNRCQMGLIMLNLGKKGDNLVQLVSIGVNRVQSGLIRLNWVESLSIGVNQEQSGQSGSMGINQCQILVQIPLSDYYRQVTLLTLRSEKNTLSFNWLACNQNIKH